jgi:hypothetical protein
LCFLGNQQQQHKMEDPGDLSESSSVRMERELEEVNVGYSKITPLSSSEHNDEEAEESTHHSMSSLHAFDCEIRRMTRDADKILESIRKEVNSSSSDATTKAKTKENSSVSNGGSSSHSFGISKLKSEISSPLANNFVADDDDDMTDELERLDSFTAAIRESLDTKNDDNMPLITSPMNITSLSSVPSAQFTFVPPKNDKALVKPSSTVASNPKEECPLIIPRSSSSSTKSETIISSARTSTAHAKPTYSNTTASSVETSKDASASSLADNLLEQTGSQEYLLLAVTLVWAVVLLLLVHAKYHLLDENGVVRLPLYFA